MRPFRTLFGSFGVIFALQCAILVQLFPVHGAFGRIIIDIGGLHNNSLIRDWTMCIFTSKTKPVHYSKQQLLAVKSTVDAFDNSPYPRPRLPQVIWTNIKYLGINKNKRGRRGGSKRLRHIKVHTTPNAKRESMSGDQCQCHPNLHRILECLF